jgi:predicted transcriptional regulator
MNEIEATINGKQEKALELVLRGLNDVEVAKKIGVTRQTVSNWRHYNTVFIETLSDERKLLREKHQDRINGLVEKAIDVMTNALDDEDPKIRLQAVKLVLSTAALKDSMKEKNEPSEKNALLKELGEALGWAGKELGYTEPGK